MSLNAMVATGTEDARTVNNYDSVVARVIAATADAYDNNSLSRTMLTKSQRNRRYSNAASAVVRDADLEVGSDFRGAVMQVGLNAAERLAYDGDFTSDEAREIADRLD